MNKTKITKEELKKLVLDNVEDFSMYDYSDIKDMSELFKNETSLVKFPKLLLDNVEHMDSMFEGCLNLEHFEPLSMISCKTANAMFKGCLKITIIDIFDTQNIEEMDSIFEDCANLVSLPHFVFGMNVTKCARIFAQCASINEKTMDFSDNYWKEKEDFERKKRIQEHLESRGLYA